MDLDNCQSPAAVCWSCDGGGRSTAGGFWLLRRLLMLLSIAQVGAGLGVNPRASAVAVADASWSGCAPMVVVD